MANVPYHTHTFIVPSANQPEAEEGLISDKVMSPLTTKQAILANVSLVGRTGEYEDILNKPNVATIDAINEALDAAQGYRDDAIAAVASVRPLDKYPTFYVVVGQNSVVIPGGYSVGSISQIFLNGDKLTDTEYSATNGITVTFPTITSDDLAEGETSLSLDVYYAVGDVPAGFEALNLRYNRRFCEVVVDLVYDADTATPTDNREAIQSLLDTGRTVVIPADPTGENKWAGYKKCLYQTKPGQVVYDYSRKRSLDPSFDGNGDVWPMWIQTATATEAVWEGGDFDHRGMDWTSPTEGPGAANVGFAAAMLMMADRGKLIRPGIFNGFDNGLGIMRADLNTGAFTPGSPSQTKALYGYSENCGVGMHTHSPEIGPHQVGSGVNFLSGSLALVIGWHDRLSRTNFIADYAGGASGQFIGCIGDFAQTSISGSADFDGETIPIGGFGIYSGCTHVKWIGVQISDAASWGAFFDGFSAFNDIEVTIKYCGRGGILLQGRSNKLMARVHDAGHLVPGTYPGIRVRGGAVFEGGAFGSSFGQQVINPHVEGPYTAYGMQILTGGGGVALAYGGSDGGMLQGSLADVSNAQPDTFSVVNYRDISTPKFVKSFYNVVTAANDAAAAAAGVPVNGEYRNGSVIMKRIA